MTITNDSRYIQAAHESADAHTYDDLGNIEFDSVDTYLKNVVRKDTTYLITTKLGTPPPTQYMVKETDNIQLLSYLVQRDPHKWWVIADANPQIRHPFDMKMGDMIHLPD
jgi:hypothetical protein